MSDEPQPVRITAVPTSEEALREAARLLRWAEGETNPNVWEPMVQVADRWINIGAILRTE